MKKCIVKNCKNKPIFGVATVDSLWTLTKNGFPDLHITDYGGHDIEKAYCAEHLHRSDYQEEFEEELAENS